MTDYVHFVHGGLVEMYYAQLQTPALDNHEIRSSKTKEKRIECQ